MTTPIEPVLLGGAWRAADSVGTFQAINPDTGNTLDHVFPVSSRADVAAALDAGSAAAVQLAQLDGEQIARFLDEYAGRIDAGRDEITATANVETALPVSPRLADIELPRTTGQLRQAARAARDGSWSTPTIDTATNIRTMLGPLGGPVAVFGPNNFPLAFNGISGGDFAAAITAGNPVIAKAHPSHPRTSQLLARAAAAAIEATNMPAATVQMIYRTSHEDGAWLVSNPLLGATGYTGSRAAGLALKHAADRAGKPIYLELSSVNPLFILPGTLRERLDAVVDEFHGSALVGCGQFCTNPGIVVLRAGADADRFVAQVQGRFEASAAGALLGAGGVHGLRTAVATIRDAGAELLTGGEPLADCGCRFDNTLLRISGADFLANPAGAQTEAFGNASLMVIAADDDEMVRIAAAFEGNLTGCIYSHSGGDDDELYDRVVVPLRRRVGRLLNDKMPTGVAVSPAMNHGGPYPATGHPGFTAVGIPAAVGRFAMLECYDNVRAHRLPAPLRDTNPTGTMWRSIDAEWTQSDVVTAG